MRTYHVDFEELNFKVLHNLPDVQGIRIEDALVNWYARTRIKTVESFCAYVTSKGRNFKCTPIK